jgi:hypothetical protein
VENAMAIIWKTLLIAEGTLRRLDAPELLSEVTEGVAYVNGERARPSLTTAVRKRCLNSLPHFNKTSRLRVTFVYNSPAA